MSTEVTKTEAAKADSSKKATAGKDAAPKKNFFKGLKAEFGRIIWPDKDTVTKETVAVVAATVVIALVIIGLDALIQLGLNAIL